MGLASFNRARKQQADKLKETKKVDKKKENKKHGDK